MTTPGAWLTLLAAVIFVAGTVVSIRQRRTQTKALGLTGTFAAAGVVGWFAWLSTTVA